MHNKAPTPPLTQSPDNNLHNNMLNYIHNNPQPKAAHRMPPQPRPHNRLTQARVLALLDAAEEAIRKNAAFAKIAAALQSREIPAIFLSAQSHGLAESHPLAADFQSLVNIIDALIREAQSHISLSSMETLIIERAHFNPSRIKQNDFARGAMRRARGKGSQGELGEPCA